MKLFFQKYFYYIAIIAVFIIAFILRCYKLDEIPDMLHIDEASLGYNAWCLAHYGVDRYLNEMPFYAQNFMGGQSPLYTYSVVLLIKTIGRGNISILLLRIPALISSMLVVIFGTKLMSLVFQNKKVTLISALLLTICPYFIMHGRYALDCHLMLSCCTIALYLLAKYVRTQSLRDLVFCGIICGITLYSYALSYFLLPMFLVSVTLYLLYMKKITLRRAVIWACCVVVTGIPVIIFACSLVFQLEPIRFLGFVISPVATARMADVGRENFFNSIKDVLQYTLTNSRRLFEAEDKFYTLYFTSIPFVVIGVFFSCKDFILSLKRRCFHYSGIFTLYFISALLTIGITRAHATYPGNYYFIAYLYFMVLAIYRIFKFLSSYRYLFIVAVGGCYLLWGLSFCRYYFNLYSVVDVYGEHHYSIAPFTEILEAAESKPGVDNIYMDFYTIEEYYLFFYPESPYGLAEKRNKTGLGRYRFVINDETPIDTQSAYIVHRRNYEFIEELGTSGIPYKVEDSYPYYLFYAE
ncbi:MAG: glycosyltransferase family 39 protein [Lachnospiraceae bacterium]|nr:glycosyltransferase family 39 protein [Lachnospiraceae bacterium]